MFQSEQLSNIRRGDRLEAEVEEGNREYKFRLTNLSDETLLHRITQLNWRLNEGNDEAVYLIGVEDNGNQLGLSESDLQESLKNLKYMADQVGCEMQIKELYAGEKGD
jgi:GTPase